MREHLKARIRAGGEDAAAVRSYLRDRIPEAEIVSEDDPAEFVMMTVDDYDEALEDAAAAAACARTRGEESLPIELVDRLLAGESPIRIWREHRKMTLAGLAGNTGIAKGHLSQLENGERNGTIETIKKLAAALNVDLEDIV